MTPFFDTAPDATNVDKMRDFEVAVDKIALSLAVFTGITGAAGDDLMKGQFLLGKKAHEEPKAAPIGILEH